MFQQTFDEGYFVKYRNRCMSAKPISKPQLYYIIGQIMAFQTEEFTVAVFYHPKCQRFNG